LSEPPEGTDARRRLQRVRVGSRNRAKLEAVRRGLAPFYDVAALEAIAAPSGVSEQPIGLDEILAGATNRARAAWGEGGCDLAVGIEDGLIPVAAATTGYVNVGGCVVFDGRESFVGLTAGFEYPTGCVERALASPRVPVGESLEACFEPPDGSDLTWNDGGPGGGNIGLLTGGALTRFDYGAQAVICALVRMLHPALYAGERS
jgi:inosine/xanthosine triphosphatase